MEENKKHRDMDYRSVWWRRCREESMAKSAKRRKAVQKVVKNNITRHTFNNAMRTVTASQVGISFALLIEGILISRFMGRDVLSSFGLISPVTFVFTSIYGIFDRSMQRSCNRFLSRGDKEKACQVFTSSLLIGIILMIVLGMLVFSFAPGIVRILGGRRLVAPDVIRNARAFLRAMSMVYLFQFLRYTLLGTIQYLASTRYVRRVSSLKLFTHIGFLIYFIVFRRGGILGVAYANIASDLIITSILICHYFFKTPILKVAPRYLSFKDVSLFSLGGAVGVWHSICITVQKFGLNRVLIAISGPLGLAVMAVWDSVYEVVGILESVLSRVAYMLGNIYNCEKNKKSIRILLANSFFVAIVFNGFIAFLVFLLAPYIVDIFFSDPGMEMYGAAVTCIRICAVSMPVYTLISALRRYFLTAHHEWFSALISLLVEVVFFIGFAFLLGRSYGLAGFWTSYFLRAALMVFIVWVVSRVRRKELLNPKGVFAPPEDVFELRVDSADKEYNVSAAILKFCHRHGIEQRRANSVALCAEEMVHIVLKYGTKMGRKNTMCDIRIVRTNDELTLRILDNNPYFDLSHYYKMMCSPQIGEHMSVQLLFKSAKDICYVNLIDTNTLIVTV